MWYDNSHTNLVVITISGNTIWGKNIKKYISSFMREENTVLDLG